MSSGALTESLHWRILEEVVGEIQDEFDADEHTVESSRKQMEGALTPVHELPDELKLDENANEEELTSFGVSSLASWAEFRKKEKPLDFSICKSLFSKQTIPASSRQRQPWRRSNLGPKSCRKP